MALGLFDFAGDVSVRVPGTENFLIRHTRADLHVMPKHVASMTNTTERNIIRMDLDGNQLEGRVVPPLEVHTHIGIYRAREEVGAIVHAHARMATAFTMVGRSIDPVYARGVETTHGNLATFDHPDPIGTPELGEQLASALGDKRACLLRSHGLVTVGATIESAAIAAINLEDAALMQWIASALGEPKSMPDRAIESRQAVWHNPVLESLVWQYYQEITEPTFHRPPVGRLIDHVKSMRARGS